MNRRTASEVTQSDLSLRGRTARWPLLPILRSRFARIAFAWLTLTLIFSVIYWVAWMARSDSFIINKEFNLNPVEQIRERVLLSYTSIDGAVMPEHPVLQPIGLEEMTLALVELDSLTREINSSLTPLNIRLKSLETESGRISRLHSQAMSDNMEAYRTKELAPAEAEVKRRAEAVASMERTQGLSPNSYQKIILAEARVELASARLTEATKSAQVATYILDNIGTFADSYTTEAIQKLDANLQHGAAERESLMLSLRQLRERTSQTAASWRERRTDRLGWLDFVYFSVAVSSSTTFGDIIPNTRLVRMAALAQLLVSIFLLGYLVSLAGALPRQDADRT